MSNPKLHLKPVFIARPDSDTARASAATGSGQDGNPAGSPLWQAPYDGQVTSQRTWTEPPRSTTIDVSTCPGQNGLKCKKISLPGAGRRLKNLRQKRHSLPPAVQDKHRSTGKDGEFGDNGQALVESWR